jgi:hypothetical protein
MFDYFRMLMGWYRPGDKVFNRYGGGKDAYTLVENTGKKHYSRRDDDAKDCLG